MKQFISWFGKKAAGGIITGLFIMLTIWGIVFAINWPTSGGNPTAPTGEVVGGKFMWYFNQIFWALSFTGGTIQINLVTTSWNSCTLNGSIARDTIGNILSCQSGIWKSLDSSVTKTLDIQVIGGSYWPSQAFTTGRITFKKATPPFTTLSTDVFDILPGNANNLSYMDAARVTSNGVQFAGSDGIQHYLGGSPTFINSGTNPIRCGQMYITYSNWAPPSIGGIWLNIMSWQADRDGSMRVWSNHKWGDLTSQGWAVGNIRCYF